jgi:two-component system, chemotaxis family, chemotaxis protein CheY
MKIPSSYENIDTGITAIVIDDDADTVSFLSELLEIKGINVIGKGYDGMDAVKLFIKHRPTIVFLDVTMKDHDGFFTLEKIRKIQPDAIVILMTGDMSEETQKRLIELDASAIIYKPYEINEVMRQTNELIIRLKLELMKDIAAKKARLEKLNTILGNRLHESDINTIRKAQYFDEKEKLV